ncbi:MAG: D-alanyl-D-alanine dipeptidase [Cyanobacteria bacterium QS_8_48_54]|jgi:D-alanyl-D-alanine dipeptidase|nr:MAG: D-alanyl-D-alanine dipeptidase [Cyanobacteria bacterium QS_9_48_30]PSP35729.1 MAG: D-alanyl-D-alanine dipeptidase [Cyanobacteria bacterium QS_8_48_54]
MRITNIKPVKPYQQIPIQDWGEPLVPIPLEQFAVESPHPYKKLGAPYGSLSPYYLRQGVLDGLIEAQAELKQQYPDWRIKIFDAYRPIAVQQFMVDYTFAEVVRARELDSKTISEAQREAIWEEVYQLWAVPSLDPATPPPHSTGAAIDITLVDAEGQTLDLGSAIDELSARSHPDYYGNSTTKVEQNYHARRQLLEQVMLKGGFRRHPGEWWHFSLGDQMWAWQCNQQTSTNSYTAYYGRVETEN